MFDNYNRNNYNNSQAVNINAVGGTIVKNYKDSFILRFHMQSELAQFLLDKEPQLTRKEIYHPSASPYHTGHTEKIREPVVVLQVMLCGDQELLAEVMWKEDFDKMYEPKAESDIEEHKLCTNYEDECEDPCAHYKAESSPHGITKEEFKAIARVIIDTAPYGDQGVLFDYDSFEEMKVAQVPYDTSSVESDMPLDTFLDMLYERIKGELGGKRTEVEA